MENNAKLAGACGEIEVMIPERNEQGQPFSFFQNGLMTTQYCEYKIAHYIDKSLESFFGFISVLPGAFSTFRWEAIDGGPLDEFLKNLLDQKDSISCATANMYLAED